MVESDPPPNDPRRIGYNDPTVRTMGLYLQKQAEYAARRDMLRLIEEAKRQDGESPKRDL